MGPGDLAQALCGLDLGSDPRLIVGLQTADDAGVVKLRDDLALIQTVDFFTPIVDDPYLFGQIAATNALSDVYAMGGVPLCAMNIAGFPVKTMDISILNKVLKGGLDKMREAEVILVGGHTVEDKELKYGLSVTGTIHPDAVLTNHGAALGDKLVLTKPIGTGVINTAIKRDKASQRAIDQIVAAMTSLNRAAAQCLEGFEVHACTDVTGFGLLGHAAEMLEGGGLGMRLFASQVPLFDEALDYAAQGLKPGGLGRNRRHRQDLIEASEDLDPMVEIFFDPQTSGGLLVALPAEVADSLVARLHQVGVGDAAVIGEIIDGPERIELRA